MTLRVAGAARATIGTRSSQEDAFEIWPSGALAATQRGEGLLAVVADGMGGHAGGEIAGQLACQTFVTTFTGSDSAVAGRLQGALAGLRGVAGVIGPGLFTGVFAAAVAPGRGVALAGAPYLLAATMLAAGFVVAWHATQS